MSPSTDPTRRRLRPGDYVWQQHPTGPIIRRPGQVTSLHGEGWVFVHWLHDLAPTRVHPRSESELVYAEHDPDRFNVLDGADGTPLPAVLQQGGQLWHAVLFGLSASTLRLYAGGTDVEEAADNVMVALAPILSPAGPPTHGAIPANAAPGSNNADPNAPAIALTGQ